MHVRWCVSTTKCKQLLTQKEKECESAFNDFFFSFSSYSRTIVEEEAFREEQARLRLELLHAKRLLASRMVVVVERRGSETVCLQCLMC
jgi:hypothetical protein